MKKLMLDAEALAVESFPTHEAATESAGTVHAHIVTQIRCGSGGASCFTSCRADMRDNCTCPPPAD